MAAFFNRMKTNNGNIENDKRAITERMEYRIPTPFNAWFT